MVAADSTPVDCSRQAELVKAELYQTAMDDLRSMFPYHRLLPLALPFAPFLQCSQCRSRQGQDENQPCKFTEILIIVIFACVFYFDNFTIRDEFAKVHVNGLVLNQNILHLILKETYVCLKCLMPTEADFPTQWGGACKGQCFTPKGQSFTPNMWGLTPRRWDFTQRGGVSYQKGGASCQMVELHTKRAKLHTKTDAYLG